MANMPYCRFQNTLADLNDCYNALWDELSSEENIARQNMIHTMVDILGNLGLDVDTSNLQETLSELPKEV